MSLFGIGWRSVVGSFASLVLLLLGLEMAGDVLVRATRRAFDDRANAGATAVRDAIEGLDSVFMPVSALAGVQGGSAADQLQVRRSVVVVEVRDDRLLASITIKVPGAEAVSFWQLLTSGGPLSRRKAEELLGTVTINYAPLTFLPPEVRVDSAGTSELRFDARPMALPSRPAESGLAVEVAPVPRETESVIVFKPGRWRATGFPVPDEQTSGRLVWRGSETTAWVLLRKESFAPDRVPAPGDAILPTVLKGGTTGFRRAAAWLDPLVLILPLLLFLSIRWHRPPDDLGLIEFDREIVQLLIVALLLLVANGLLAMLTDTRLGAAGYVLVPWLWPALIARWDRSAAPFARARRPVFVRTTPTVVVCALVSVALSIAASARLPQNNLPGESLTTSVLLALAASATAIVGMMAFLQLLRGGLLLGAASLLLFGVLIVVTISNDASVVSLVLMLGLWGRFALALTKLETAAATAGYFLDLPRRVRRVIVASVWAFALLLAWWLASRIWQLNTAMLSVRTLTADLRPFISVIVATLLARILYHTSRTPAGRFAPQALAAGPLLGAIVFFPPTVRWYYLPITFLAGWFLLRRLISGPRPDAYAMTDPLRLRAVLDEVLDVAVFRRTLEAHRAKLFGKVVAGEMEFPEYEEKREALQGVLAAKETALRSGPGPVPESVLGLGAGADPWRNAMLNAMWGTAFATPWIVLYLRETATYSAASTLLVILQSLLVVAKWPLYGFFFGYFFARLPGWSGFTKGFWFALALTAPGILLNALSLSSIDGWQDLGFYALQVLIHSILLGLFNDFAMLRRHGFTWRALAELHNLTAVTAWFSTLIIAIATAVAALVTTQATDLFRRALEASGTVAATASSAPAPPAAPTQATGQR